MKLNMEEYLAGYIDADGSIDLEFKFQTRRNKNGRKQYPTFLPRIRIVGKPNENFEKVALTFGFAKSKNQNASVYTLRGKGATEFIQRILPYLIVKQKRAKLVMEATKIIGMQGRGNKRNLNQIEKLAEIRELIQQQTIRKTPIKWTKEKILESFTKLGYT